MWIISLCALVLVGCILEACRVSFARGYAQGRADEEADFVRRYGTEPEPRRRAGEDPAIVNILSRSGR